MTQSATPASMPFKPTREMIAAAENLFLAMAYEQTVRPIVEGYQRKVLVERSWEIDPQLQASAGGAECVTDIKSAWLMNSGTFEVYRKRCNEERVAAKLESAVNASCSQDDYCPLLVAEDLTRKARFALCDAMAGVTNIDGAKAVMMAAGDYDKIVDLYLNLLAPFVTNVLVEHSPK